MKSCDIYAVILLNCEKYLKGIILSEYIKNLRKNKKL